MIHDEIFKDSTTTAEYICSNILNKEFKLDYMLIKGK